MSLDHVLFEEEGGKFVKLIGFSAIRDIQQDNSMEGYFTTKKILVAPETVSGKLYGKPADIWGLGIFLHLMASGDKVPFPLDKNAEIMEEGIKAEKHRIPAYS